MEHFFIITGLIFWIFISILASLWVLNVIWYCIVPNSIQIWINNTLFIPRAFWIKNPDKVLKLMVELLEKKPKITKSFAYKIIVKILKWRIKKNIIEK